jgi:hypothetical protein
MVSAMQAVCAWCKQHLGIVPTGPAATRVSHGICARCADLLERFDQRRLGAFLDDIEHPVLCVDDDVRVLHGNRAAANALGKQTRQLRGHLGGEVLECTHAGEPGGCGRTGSCPACVIRGSVNTTFKTGRPVRAAEAWQFVLLHIDQDAGVSV